jgi:hypothetical protein
VITDIRIQVANVELKLLSSRVVRTSKLEVQILQIMMPADVKSQFLQLHAPLMST